MNLYPQKIKNGDRNQKDIIPFMDYLLLFHYIQMTHFTKNGNKKLA